MSPAHLAIIDEVETALNSATEAKRLAAAKLVTDLFLTSAGSFTAEQIDLFDKVLERLIKTIELRAIADVSVRIALAELSEKLAPVPQTPPSVVRCLAQSNEIAIAGPILRDSARLTAEDLVELAKSKSEQHLLAIAGRWWLKEVVTDALLARDYPSVSRRIVNNPGARVSAAGFAIVVTQAIADPELAVETGIRVDLPPALRDRLLRSATESVRARLLSRAPAHLFEEIRTAITNVAAGVNRDMAKEVDFADAKRLVESLHERGELNEATLRSFAEQRKYEETVVTLARLTRASVEVIRPLMQSLRDDGILVPCKAAGLRWTTVRAVLNCRLAVGSMSSVDLESAQRHFAEMTTEKARRLLGFWKLRIPQ